MSEKLPENVHKGHRVRLKNEFLCGAFNDNTPDYKWLEILLFYCIPQRDTNPIAHELINRFHSLAGVLEAPVEALAQIKGISENAAVLIKLIIPIMRKYEIEKSLELFSVFDKPNTEQYIHKQFYGLTKERVGVLLLDRLGKTIDFKFVGEGGFREVEVSTRDIARFALENDAQALILAHNHPNDCALPSREDIEATKVLFDALKKLNIKLSDHIIISGSDYVSLAQTSKYSNLFER